MCGGEQRYLDRIRPVDIARRRKCCILAVRRERLEIDRRIEGPDDRIGELAIRLDREVEDDRLDDRHRGRRRCWGLPLAGGRRRGRRRGRGGGRRRSRQRRGGRRNRRRCGDHRLILLLTQQERQTDDQQTDHGSRCRDQPTSPGSTQTRRNGPGGRGTHRRIADLFGEHLVDRERLGNLVEVHTNLSVELTHGCAPPSAP